MDRKLATTEEVADLLRLDAGTLRKWRMRGEGPPSYTIGNKARYDLADLETWLRSRQTPKDEKRQHTVGEWLEIMQEFVGDSEKSTSTSQGLLDTLETALDCEHEEWETREYYKERYTVHCEQCGMTPRLLIALGEPVHLSCGAVIDITEMTEEEVGNILTNHESGVDDLLGTGESINYCNGVGCQPAVLTA